MDKKFIELDDDNQIAYQIYGQGDKFLIIFHGLVGGSWLDPDLRADLIKTGLSIVVPERIGYGDSSQFEIEKVADWIPIMQKMAKELQIKKADVVGISAGAPYAYTAACALPDTVEKIWILAGIPEVYKDSILEHYTERNREIYKQFLHTDLPTLQSSYQARIAAYQQEIMPGGYNYISRTVEEILAHRCFGMALESRLQITPWGIDTATIEQPVDMFHAKADDMVPYDAAKQMAQSLKNCELYRLNINDEDAHMSSSMAAWHMVIPYYMDKK